MSRHAREIARNALVVASATLLSRILGFVRDLIVAMALGAGLFADAFFVAFRVPNLMRRLFGEGSLTMAFIPVFSRTATEQGDEQAFAMARSTLAWLAAILGAVTALAMFFAGPVVSAIAPGFTDNPELFAAATKLLRICFPYTIFICAVALCMGILNARRHFLAPALAPCILNAALITAALIGYYSGGDVALYLAWGVLAGGLGQWLLQQPFLRARGFAWKGPWAWRDPNVLRMARLMLPTVFGAAVYQINILMGTLLASFLPVGSISYLYYADRLVQFPLGVFGLAVSTAALPSLARIHAEKRMDEFTPALSSALGLTLFISLPAMAGLMALNAPVIDLLFGRGAFTDQAVASTAAALTAYAAGLPAVALVRPLVSAFYAMEDTRTPVLIAAASVAVNIAAGAVLMQFWLHVGLAAAASLSSYLNALLLWVFLRKRIPGRPVPRATALKCLALSLVVGLGAWASARYGLVWVAAVPVLALGYFLACLGLGMPEARLFSDMLRSRLKRGAR